MKTTKKRDVTRTDKLFFNNTVKLCQENLDVPNESLAKRIHQNSGKTLSACQSLVSSIKCCLNAFAGKASFDSAQYGLAKGFEKFSEKEEILSSVRLVNCSNYLK
jgi:hypothetical protein